MPPPRAGKKINPSMQDVARHAGVSIATVSNVINRPEKVTEATAVRVRAAIQSMGFVRNEAARSLAVGSTTSIGLVVADLVNSLFADLAHGAQRAANAADMRLLLGNTLCDPEIQDDYLDLFDETRVAGLLLAPMLDSSAGIERMRAHGRQIVLLNYAQADGLCCTVLVDNEMVGYLAARHLIESGRKRLAFVASLDPFQPIERRREGVERAVAEAGSGVQLEEVDTRGILHEDGLRAAEQLALRSRENVPDGIVAVTDAIGNGIIQGLLSQGQWRIPTDVGVVGCEDNRYLGTGQIPLTTVAPPGVEMGRVAIDLLLEEIAALPGEHQHRTIVLQPTMSVRASSVAGDPHRQFTPA
jgi:LacI family transcriptional regulator